MRPLAIIPARSGSRGCPGKNLRLLGGKNLIQLAIDCAHGSCHHESGCTTVAVTSDLPREVIAQLGDAVYIRRPSELAQDDTPMIAVVKHALEQIPGPPDQPIVLLQPTQPFRKPEHVTEALRLLREPRPGLDDWCPATSAVSVKELPRSHNGCFQLSVGRYSGDLADEESLPLHVRLEAIARRQDTEPRYIRDGTVYAFFRKTVSDYDSIYGPTALPLVIDPADTCELDTESDWLEVQRRYYAKHERRVPREAWIKDASGQSFAPQD